MVSKKRFALIGLGGAVITSAVAGAFVLGQKSPGANNAVADDQTSVQSAIDEPLQFETFMDDSTGLQFSHVQRLAVIPLSDVDEQDGFIARLSTQDPPVTVTVRVESGLRSVAVLSSVDVPTLLQSNIAKALPNRYPEFNLVSSSDEDIGSGQRLLKTDFTYTGPSGDIIRQILLVVIIDDDSAAYITTQTTDALYDAVQADYFDPIIASLSIQ